MHNGTKIDCGLSIGGHCYQKRLLDTESVTKPKVSKLPPRVQKKPRKADFEDPSTIDDDADGDICSMIWRIFGYNTNKYHDMDNEDDDLLEADFHTIQMEERRSARMAQQEDERELAMIKEEERREKELARKKASKAALLMML